MTSLSKDELRARIKQLTQSKHQLKQKGALTIEETEDGFRIDTLTCTGLPKAQATVLLLLCNGLTREQCAAALNKSVGAVKQNINSICMRLLGSNVNGNPDGRLSAAVAKAFCLAYLYHHNKTVFSATEQEWVLIMTKFRCTDSLVCEASRLVFVNGKSIEDAAIQTGIDFEIVNSAVRELEQILGQNLEMMALADDSRPNHKLK